MATIDELKKKDGSAVNAGAVRPKGNLFPYNQPEVDIYANAGVGSQPAADKVPGPGVFPYNQSESNIYGGLGKSASAPENQPGPRGILGNKPIPPKPLGNPSQIPTGQSAPMPVQPATAIASPNQIQTSGYPEAPAAVSNGATPKTVQPLDAQAQADRATAAGIMGGLGAMNRRAGAAIADVATLIPRGLAGAYDTAVVRPMRAAGMDAAYLSPKLAPEGSDPASQTPFYDQIRQQDAAAALVGATANATQPVQQSEAETTRLNRGAVQKPAPTATPVAQAQPAAPKPQAPMAAGALPQSGQVTRVGNSYSGANVSGDISINGAPPRGGVISAQDNQAAANLARSGGQTSGFGPAGAIRGGGQVSSIDTSAGYASDLRQLAEIEKNKAAQEAGMQGQADYAAMRAGHMSNKAYQTLLAGRQADATARRGQDIQAGATRDSSRLAQDRLKLDASKANQDATNANLDNESKTMLLNAQKAFANAKTPEERQAAMAVLSGLSGKSQQSAPWKGFALQGSTDAMGNKTEGVLAGFNEQTGEVRRMDQGTAKAATQAPPEGTTLTKDGKTYVVKNGVPVLL